MPDFNPNEMDALFREGADRHEFEYNPDAWMLMEEKLDKRARKRRILFLLLGLLFIIASIAIYKNLKSNKEEVNPVITSTISKTSKVSDESKKEAKLENVKINEPTVIEESSTQNEINKEYISTDSKESRSNIGAQNSFQSENTGNLMGHEIVSIASPIEGRKEEVLQDKEDEEDNTSITIIEETTKSIVNKELVQLTALQTKELNQLPFNRDYVDGNELKFSSTVQKTPKAALSNRWTATLFANPEWSSVGLFRESKTGWSFGTKLGYQFADKFEISAGLAYSRKIYKGGGDAYTMAGGWYDNIEPMRMDAKCDVIEIPIGLSYHLNGFRNNGLFFDLGINSYMLHSEWYGFEYDDLLVRPDRYTDVNEADQNSHLIGVGRIAIGYQKILSNNSSIQVAPYLQFPLTGIGAGQVNVYSSGVQLAVKFNTQ